MEDKKRKKEDKRKRETSQKVAEQKNKVPELTKPPSAQSPATPNSASPSPGPVPSAPASTATAAAGVPLQGGNNGKRPAVANGQPSPGTQAPQRYMPREVPPRFRCQQDHKVLLKRGQPPLSSMLLGGGNGGGDGPSTTVAAVSDSSQGSVGPAAPSLPHTSSSSSIAASSTTTTSNYANSMWGASSVSQPLSQGREKVIVDGSNLEEWPTIAPGDGGVRTGDSAVARGLDGSAMPNCSASWGERHLQQQKAVGAGGGKGGESGSTSPPSSSGSPNECMQSGGSVWGSSNQASLGGNALVAGSLVPISKASSLPGTPDSSLGVSGGIPGANFNPNTNPSAWPALVQDGAGAAVSEAGLSTSLQSSTSSSANNPSLCHPPHSVNHPLHQMQSREPSCGEWGGAALEQGAGPKIPGVTEEGSIDCSGGNGGEPSGASSSSSSTTSSSWRALPFPANNSKTGASRTDDWEGVGGSPASAEAGGNSWGYSSESDRQGSMSTGSWGAGNGGSCQTPGGVSQGGWGGVGEWGGGGGGMGGVGVIGNPDGSSSNSSSSSSRESAGNRPTSLSSAASATTRAWDNQKSVGGDTGAGDQAEWGGQGSRGGGDGGTSSSSGGANSRSGSSSGPHNQHHHGHHRSHQSPNAEVALQNLLSRTDLDPRVLSNTGWGQTQIRQNVAWDLVSGSSNPSVSSAAQASSAPHSGSTASSSADPSASSSLVPSGANLNSSSTMASSAVGPGEGWDNNSNSVGASLQGRGSLSNSSAQSAGLVGQGRPTGSWGGEVQSESQGKSWGSENQDWTDRRAASGWGDLGQQGNPTRGGGGGGGGWGSTQEDKGTGSWKEMGRDGSGWGQKCGGGSGGGEWREPEPKSGSSGWGDGNGVARGPAGDTDGSTWGGWDDGAPRRAWGAGGEGGGDVASKAGQGWGGKVHPSQMPNSQAALLKGPGPQQQQSQPPQSQSLDPGAMQGGWGRPSGPPSQSQSSGLTSGPNPQMSSGPGEAPQPSGWEEPSPQSISRKLEIDDGTSAWGDPTNYNYKSVNLWDKNGATGQPQSLQSQQQQQAPPTVQQMPVRQPSVLANRDMNHAHSKGPPIAPSSWGGGGSSGTPNSPCVDNGTAAWGNPSEKPAGWGDPDSGKAAGWGSPTLNPIKSGSMPMQEGWGEAEGSQSASRHSSWEEEEEGGGMWNSAGSQGSSSSYNSGGWGQSHGAKKGIKGSMKSGGGSDTWMNPMTRQFTNMGLLGEDPTGRPLDLAPGPPQDKKLDGDRRGMGLNDYNGEMRKGGRGGAGGGLVFRSPNSKEVGPGETGPYCDKQNLPFTNQDGCLGEEGPCSPFSPPTVFKPSPLYNHPNPTRQVGSHNVFGGGGMAQSRHQSSVPPVNPTPGVRAQMPHQYLSPQVPGSVLKQMPPPSGGVGGVGGGVFPPQLSPQHIAMLSTIYPPIQFQLACQLLLQQQQQQQPQQQQLLQNQRKFPQSVQQQADPQQIARIMAVIRQQQQQLGGSGGGSKLSPSHLTGSAPKMPMTDSLHHGGLGGSVADLQAKGHGGYSGFGSGVNMSGLDLGSVVGGGLKESGGQQSRFKWMIEGHSPAPSPPDAALKNGPISAPMKPRGNSPYTSYEMMGGEGVPSQFPSDNWHRTPGKMGPKTGTSSWPPEFQPGVPWKGIQNVDPESDPYMTPGSMLSSSGAPNLNDSDHQLLRDNIDSNPSLNTLLPSPGAWPYSASESPINSAHNTAKYTDYKPSWPPEPIGHNKLWKANRNSSQLPRPPPGLSHQKQPTLSPWAGAGPRLARGGWGGPGSSQESRYGPGSAWSDGSSRGSCWLLLSNLTPQIDGSTLRTICMQHGPLLTFHLSLNQGSALIRYSSRQEAAKAQSALHMCVLGNTTILAEFVSEEEVTRYFAHSQAGAATSSGASVGVGVPGASSCTGTGGSAGVPGAERDRTGSASVSGPGGNGGVASGAGGSAGVGPSGSSWSLDGTGSSPDPTSSGQGAGLSIFAQWSSNGAGGGGPAVVGAVEPSRGHGLWGGIPSGYAAGSSLWGSPALDDRHQMSSPAPLLPGDLLGGGADSI